MTGVTWRRNRDPSSSHTCAAGRQQLGTKTCGAVGRQQRSHACRCTPAGSCRKRSMSAASCARAASETGAHGADAARKGECLFQKRGGHGTEPVEHRKRHFPNLLDADEWERCLRTHALQLSAHLTLTHTARAERFARQARASRSFSRTPCDIRGMRSRSMPSAAPSMAWYTWVCRSGAEVRAPAPSGAQRHTNTPRRATAPCGPAAPAAARTPGPAARRSAAPSRWPQSGHACSARSPRTARRARRPAAANFRAAGGGRGARVSRWARQAAQGTHVGSVGGNVRGVVVLHAPRAASQLHTPVHSTGSSTATRDPRAARGGRKRGTPGCVCSSARTGEEARDGQTVQSARRML
jgi:hypothetical protein